MIARVFVLGKPFHPSLMFAGSDGAYPSEAGAPLLVRLLAFPTNIRLGWKGLPETNSLAYYEKFVNYVS